VDSDLLRIFEALGDAGVRYLVVGGVAVVLHGHLRVTADVDLVVQLEPANVLAATKAFAALGFRPRAPVPLEQFADARTRDSWVAEKGLTVFSLWSASMPGTEIDLFVKEPFDFDEAHARALQADVAGVRIPVAAIDDLVTLKRAAGRPQDQEDIRALLALKGAKPDD
jgi:predicted nucleotidyltransferase